MKRLLFIVAVIATATTIVFGYIIADLRRENNRLNSNQHALIESITLYRLRDSTSAASVEKLTLQLDEFRALREADTEHIRKLGIRLRRAESYARTALESHHEGTLPLRDTIIVHDTVKIFNYSDKWSRLAGILLRDSIHYSLHSVDTIRQVIHRVPRRWWFMRFGTRAIRQEMWSSNPNTRLVYTEYIELQR